MRTRKGSNKSMKEDSEEESSTPPAESKKNKQQIMREKNKKQGISQPSQQIGKKKLKGQVIQKRKSNSRNKKQQQEQAQPQSDRSDTPQKAPSKIKSKDKKEQMDQKQIESRLRVIQQKNWKTKIRVPKGMKLSGKQERQRQNSGQESNLQQPSSKKQVRVTKSTGKVRESKHLKSGNKSEDTHQLLKLVYSKEMMDSYLQIIGYDLKKMPVENLSKDTITDAYGILRSLEFQLKSKNDKMKIEELSRQFYEDIPHDFGFSTMEKNILDSSVLISEKKLLLDSLLNYKTVATLVPSAMVSNADLDEVKGKLDYKISVTPPNTQQYDLIKKYLQSNHSQIHKRYKIEPLAIYSVQSERQDKHFENGFKNRKLLWFGTRLNNISALLCKGFALPQFDLPVASAPYGKGFYFTDCSSKAANNCYISKEEKIAVLLVCEVALGESVEMYYADAKASMLPPGKTSVKSVGKYSPSAGRTQEMDGARLPMGPLEPVQKMGTSFLFNEYVVYRPQQVRMKYLLRVRFDDAPE